jgi:acetyl-CoA carboxylase biotin carboxyl carrier protein
MSLTAKDVAEIVRLLDQSSFDELNLEVGDLKLRLKRGESGEIEDLPASVQETNLVRPERSRRAHPQDSVQYSREPAPPKSATDTEGLLEVPSPLLGIFYRAPKPGAPPFVEIGQTVEEDTIVGIVEVMKLMNSVRAGLRGDVVEIPAANGALVEYGDPLVRVRPAA